MTDKEKIIELLQTRMEKLQNSDSRDDSIAYYEVGHIIDLIKALPEEPVSDDLEEAADKYIQGFHTAIRRMCKECFKDGARRQKHKDVEKTLSWLEYHCDAEERDSYKEYMEDSV